MEYNPEFYKICLASQEEENLIKKCLVYLGIEYFESNKEHSLLIDRFEWYIITEANTDEEINNFINDWHDNKYGEDYIFWNEKDYLLLAHCLIFGLI